MRRRSFSLVAVAVTVGLSACATGDGRQLAPPEFAAPATTIPELPLPSEPPTTDRPAVTGPFALIASWPSGARIPVRYTCDGENIAPALTWTNVPEGSVELAVTLVDLDASGFVHWVLVGIDPAVTSLTEQHQPPPGVERVNSAGTTGWFGPCPPVGSDDHIYLFTVHALAQPLDLAADASPAEVISILNQLAIDQASLTGTFARSSDEGDSD